MIIASINKSINFNKPDKKIILTQKFVNPGILKRNLVLKNGYVSNLHVIPFRNFIVDNSAMFFSGKKYLDGDAQFWAIFRLVNNLKPKLDYFGNAVQFEGFTSHLVNLIEQLKLNNVSAVEMQSLGSNSQNIKKWNELDLIKRSYDEYLENNMLFDYSGSVIRLVQEKIIFNNTYLLQFNKSYLEEELIKASGINVIVHENDESKYQLSGYKVDTFNQEVLQTIRNIRVDFESPHSPLKIGICVPDYDKAFYQFSAELNQINLPELIHFSKGTPFFQTSLGRLLSYLNDWISDDYSVKKLVKLFESGHFNHKSFGDYDFKTFSIAVSYFNKSNIVLFDSNFIDAFKNYLDGKIVEKDEESESLIPIAVELAGVMADSFNSIISGSNIGERIKSFTALMVNISFSHNQIERVALLKLQNLLDDFLYSGLADNPSFSWEVFIATVNERLAAAHVGLNLPDYTKPILGSINDLLYYEFDKLYILGMNEKGFPRKVFQNPLMLDFEIDLLKSANINAMFYKAIDRQEENDSLFNNLKSIVSKHLVFSAPLKDLSSGREYLVSRYLLAEWDRYYKSKGETKEIDYKSVSKDLADSFESVNNYVCANPADSFYNYETAVSIEVNNSGKKLVGFDLAKNFPCVKSILDYKANLYNSHTFDSYWGFLNLDENRELPVFSSSRITKWINCPYQYFLSYELKLEKVKDYDKSDLAWLDNLEYGNFLHQLFFNFSIRLREIKGIDFNSVEKKDELIFNSEFDNLIEKYKRNFPVKSEIHFLNQYNRLKQDASQFFLNELDNKNIRKYFELSFGMPDKKGRDPLKHLDIPAEIKLNDGIILKFRGSIDRVDILPEGNYLLIDYKTGKPKRSKASAPFDGGKFIQAGVYPLIVSQIDNKITNPIFEYYFTNSKEGNDRLRFNGSTLVEFKKLLTAIVSQIRKGNFVPVINDYKNIICDYCDFKEECLKGKKSLALSKKIDDTNYSNYQNITKEKLDEII